MTVSVTDSAAPDLVFVYGTLKRGGSNHHWLDGAPWQGRARLADHRLHDLGTYPMAVPGRGVVHGEVFRVAAADLARLDILEDVPQEYRREVGTLTDGRRAWVYVGAADQVRGAPRLPYDDWTSTPLFLPAHRLHPDALQRCCPGWDGTAWAAWLADGSGLALADGDPWQQGMPTRQLSAGQAWRRGGGWGVVCHLGAGDLAGLRQRWPGAAARRPRSRRVLPWSPAGRQRAVPVQLLPLGEAFSAASACDSPSNALPADRPGDGQAGSGMAGALPESLLVWAPVLAGNAPTAP